MITVTGHHWAKLRSSRQAQCSWAHKVPKGPWKKPPLEYKNLLGWHPVSNSIRLPSVYVKQPFHNCLLSFWLRDVKGRKSRKLPQIYKGNRCNFPPTVTRTSQLSTSCIGPHKGQQWSTRGVWCGGSKWTANEIKRSKTCLGPWSRALKRTCHAMWCDVSWRFERETMKWLNQSKISQCAAEG